MIFSLISGFLAIFDPRLGRPNAAGQGQKTVRAPEAISPPHTKSGAIGLNLRSFSMDTFRSAGAQSPPPTHRRRHPAGPHNENILKQYPWSAPRAPMEAPARGHTPRLGPAGSTGEHVMKTVIACLFAAGLLPSAAGAATGPIAWQGAGAGTHPHLIWVSGVGGRSGQRPAAPLPCCCQGAPAQASGQGQTGTSGLPGSARALPDAPGSK
jgi:hypothetical protein